MGSMDCIDVAQDKERWLELKNVVINIQLL
jgi:hypothetical protein